MYIYIGVYTSFRIKNVKQRINRIISTNLWSLIKFYIYLLFSFTLYNHMMYVLYVYMYVVYLFLSYWAQLFMVDYQKSKQFFWKNKYILNNKMIWYDYNNHRRVFADIWWGWRVVKAMSKVSRQFEISSACAQSCMK